MGQLQDAFSDAAGEVANIKAQPSNRYWWLYGTIKAKNSNGTLDVAIDGVTIQQVKATVSCMTANVGDRVIVLKAGPLMTCVDVIATSDEVKVPASSITGTLPESALPTSSTTAKGIMQVGSGLTVSDGIVSVDNASHIKVVEFYEIDGAGQRLWAPASSGWYSNGGLSQNHVGDYSSFMNVSGSMDMTFTKAGQYAFFFSQGFKTAGRQVGCGLFLNGVETKTVAYVPSNSNVLQCVTLSYARRLNAGDVVSAKTFSDNAPMALNRAFTSLVVIAL